MVQTISFCLIVLTLPTIRIEDVEKQRVDEQDRNHLNHHLHPLDEAMIVVVLRLEHVQVVISCQSFIEGLARSIRGRTVAISARTSPSSFFGLINHSWEGVVQNVQNIAARGTHCCRISSWNDGLQLIPKTH